jgi:hypothetical protein
MDPQQFYRADGPGPRRRRGSAQQEIRRKGAVTRAARGMFSKNQVIRGLQGGWVKG